MKTTLIGTILAFFLLTGIGSAQAHTIAYLDGYKQGKIDKKNGNPIDAAATCDSFGFGNNRDWNHCVIGYNDAVRSTSAHFDTSNYGDGYNYGVNDWNSHASDTSHHFICPIAGSAPTSAFCRGYDAALAYENSDQGGSNSNNNNNCTSEGCNGDYTCVNPDQPKGVPGCPTDFNATKMP